MQTFLTILLSLVLGWGCSHIARQRSHNPMNWFIAGVFFGVFALAALFLFLKGTRVRRSLLPQSLPKLAVFPPPMPKNCGIFSMKKKRNAAHQLLDALSRAWRKGKVKENSYVWNKLMENWQLFHEVIKTSENLIHNLLRFNIYVFLNIT